jgi:branched-chain amino acid transport system ATP-binding protein
VLSRGYRRTDPQDGAVIVRDADGIRADLARSGGEPMMLALARALVSEPRFILLDEPTAGLSPALVGETLDRVRDLARRGIGIVMVEQNIREALPIADRLYILAAGEKRFEGTPDDVRDDAQIMSIYMGG